VALSAQIGYIVPWVYEIYCVGMGTHTTKDTKCSSAWSSWR